MAPGANPRATLWTFGFSCVYRSVMRPVGMKYRSETRWILLSSCSVIIKRKGYYALHN